MHTLKHKFFPLPAQFFIFWTGALSITDHTQLHSAPTSGMQHLPQNIRVVVGENESSYSFWASLYQDSIAGVEAFCEIDFDSACKLSTMGSCADVFGDGSFWPIHTPGRRKGHVSYLLNGKERAVLITGNACDINVGFDCFVGPGFGSHNILQAQRTLERMIEFVVTYPQMNVFFGHEVP